MVEEGDLLPDDIPDSFTATCKDCGLAHTVTADEIDLLRRSPVGSVILCDGCDNILFERDS